jgi:hypothetical protein
MNSNKQNGHLYEFSQQSHSTAKTSAFILRELENSTKVPVGNTAKTSADILRKLGVR